MKMANSQSPYSTDPIGSTVLESTTILSQVLRSEGYSKDIINDIAVGLFINNERININAPSNMHLIALKKALLYAIPIIAPPNINIGIGLTTQVATPAIQYNAKYNKVTSAALAIGDKIRLIGLTFPQHLVNHLAYDIFPWKYFIKTPDYYQKNKINISHLNGIETKKTSAGLLYLIKSNHYEDLTLFNSINHIIAFQLLENFTSIIALKHKINNETFLTLDRIDPYLNGEFIKRLNTVLPQQIDQTYTLSFYEALQMTTNWLLYDQIELLGFESPEVNKYLTKLAYIKEQNLKVQANLRTTYQQILLNTRAEKITRDRYPYFFDYTDRRALFTHFHRFSIDRLPKKEKKEIEILLEKDLAAQNAILLNSCEHLIYLKELNDEKTKSAYHNIESFINYDSVDENKMYSCKLCTYPLLCEHEIEFYDALSTITENADSSDQTYWLQQKIINKYKTIDKRRTGDEDTESSFTFYCKYCGGELGKSADIIQATIKTQNESSLVIETNPIDSSIFSSISIIINAHMNSLIMPLSRKSITKLIFEETKDAINLYIKRATKNEQENIDTMIRYLTYIYTLASLISININKIKSTESILIYKTSSTKQDEVSSTEPVSGGAELKTELITALKIIQGISSFKRINVTNDKIKTMLLEAFKYMNNIFSNEIITLKATTPSDRLRYDIYNSPIATYAKFMQNRNNPKNKSNDTLDIVGVNLDILFPKGKKVQKLTTHALYTNIYKSTKNESTERGKYLQESYQSIIDFVTGEPIIGKYISIVTPPTSEFIRQYERKQLIKLKLKKDIPVRFLPVENGREYDFELKILQISYCLNEDGSVKPHRWSVTKDKNKLIYTCRYCNINIEKVSKELNDKIEDGLDEQMMKEAFFELYTLTCPIKDAHIFEADSCIQCSVTKKQIESMDLKYYKRYAATYVKHRESITTQLLDDATTISKYSVPIDKKELSKLEETFTAKVDMIKLENLASSLSKLYGYQELKSIGIDSTNKRSLDIIQSYVRLFYSHYTFAKNISIDTRSHPDPKFFSFIKENFFSGIKPKQINLPKLPEYPQSLNADQLLIDLFEIIYNIASKADADTSKLLQFIVTKLVHQNSRHKEFNFAKLKAITTISDEEDELEIITGEDDEEDEFDMFDGYDMDHEDMEDNIDGDLD